MSISSDLLFPLSSEGHRPRSKKQKRRYSRRFKTVPCYIKSDLVGYFNAKHSNDSSPSSSNRNRNFFLGESLNKCMDFIKYSLQQESISYRNWNSDQTNPVPKLDLSFLNESDSNRSDQNLISSRNGLAIITIYQSPCENPTRPEFVPELDLSFLSDSSSDDNNCSVFSSDETTNCFIIHQGHLIDPVRPSNVPKLDLSFFCDSADRKVNEDSTSSNFACKPESYKKILYEINSL